MLSAMAAILTTSAFAEESLEIAVRSLPADFNTLNNKNVEESRVISDLYEGLTKRGHNGGFIPASAEKWEVSDDGMVWKFYIRDDLVWSDGTPITAQTFLDSIKIRAEADRNGEQNGGNELSKIAGYTDYVSDENTDFTNVQVRVSAPNILEIELEAADPYFLEHTTLVSAFLPLPTHNLESIQSDNILDAVTNGAYLPVEYSSEEGVLEMKKNPKYYDHGNVFFDKLNFRLHNLEEDSIFELFKDKKPFIGLYLDQEEIEWFEKNNPEYVSYQARKFITYLDINFKSEPFDKIDIRKALALSLDRSVFPANPGNKQSATIRWLPSTLLGATEQDYSSDILRGDIEEASQLLSQHGYSVENPIAFDFYVPDSDDGKALLMKAQWERIGFDITMHVNPLQEHYLDYLVKGDFDIGYAGWSSETDDPFYYLYLAHSNPDIADIFNFGSAKNTEFDALLDQIILTSDQTERMRIAEMAENVLIDNYLKIPVGEQYLVSIVSPELEGGGASYFADAPSSLLRISE